MQPIEFAFDVSAIDPFVAGNNPLPTGKYPAKITEMEVKEAKNKTAGHFLQTVYTVTRGEFAGRKFYDNINLWFTGNNQEKTVEIAYRQLASIGHAVGVTAGNDLTLLAEKEMEVELELQDATPDQVDPNTGNAIKGRPAGNRIIRRDPIAPAGMGTPNLQAQAQAASNAPAFNPAAQAQQAAAAPSPTPAQAQAQQQAAQAAPAAGAPAAGQATPPWLKKAG